MNNKDNKKIFVTDLTSRMLKYCLFWQLLIVLCSSCAKDEFTPFSYSFTQLPNFGNELSILAIGNSFTENAIDSLPSLVNNIGVDYNIYIYKATINSSTLEDHYNNLLSSSNLYTFAESSNMTNFLWNEPLKMSLNDILLQSNFDFIILQQFSGLSGKWESIRPYLIDLINLIRANTQYEPNFIWHMTWAYELGANHPYFELYDYSDEKMYSEILQVSQEIISSTPINWVIPSAEMVTKLRDINPTIDYTCDGYHIIPGLGNIALSSLWYKTLIYPFTKIDITTCFEKSNYNLSDNQIDDIIYSVNKSIKWEE